MTCVTQVSPRHMIASSSIRLYRQCSLIRLTDSWLTDVTTAYIDMDGYIVIHHDRDPVNSGKKSGGGVCMYVNKQWCHPGHHKAECVI